MIHCEKAATKSTYSEPIRFPTWIVCLMLKGAHIQTGCWLVQDPLAWKLTGIQREDHRVREQPSL